ncbi:hypothetical protein LV89_04259 [Arcicella aurantiaca]|uniref:HNH endonuclease n=1 Tax=Arcicella aurantiaca TaxID=591202 RepID=A0A316DJX9_9BACT|nr:hypothetical protein [Arcicella aurantiaca]PWK17812.1 hypothetical protein LV89_04259 [Arcicella aurantiaca]
MAESRKYSVLTLKKLFALSGNKCCFLEQDCSVLLFDGETFNGEIAHIEGLNNKSARYNSQNINPNEFDNLIVMCPSHHSKIDKNEGKYTTSILKQWKAEHEAKFLENPTLIDEDRINSIIENQIIIDNSITTINSNNTINNNYYGNQSINQILEDDEIIREIFDYIDTSITYPSEHIRSLTKENINFRLKVKIDLNFPEEHRNRVNSMIVNSTKRKNLVDDYLRELSELNDDKPDILREKIQSCFCEILGVTDHNIKIKDFSAFEKLAKRILPVRYIEDSKYQINAKAIIIHYFEICNLGEEPVDLIQLNLF